MTPIARRLECPLAPMMTWSWSGDPQMPPGLGEVAGQADVLLAGRGIAARMVVDDDDRGGVADRARGA